MGSLHEIVSMARRHFHFVSKVAGGVKRTARHAGDCSFFMKDGLNTTTGTESGQPSEQPEEARFLRAVDAVASAIGSALPTEELLKLALDQAIQAMGAHSGSIYLPAGDGYWRLALSQNLPTGLAEVHLLLPPTSQAPQSVVESRSTIYFTQKVEEREGPASDGSIESGSQSWAASAIYSHDSVLGIIGVSSREYDAFGPGELQVLKLIGQ